MNARLKVIEDLGQFINDKEKVLQNILDDLKWTKDKIENDEVKVQCPIDSGHWIAQSSLTKHVDVCSWVKDGYTSEDIEKEPPSSKFAYEKASSVESMTITDEVLGNLLKEKGFINISSKHCNGPPSVPKSVDRWFADFSTEERLAVYDYVVKESKVLGSTKNISLDDLMINFGNRDDTQSDNPKSELQLLAEQRDYKRRRQTYRAKNVHITKKSYTEVMREVIENQIAFLKETRKLECEETKDDNRSESGSSQREAKRRRHRSSSAESSYRYSRRSRSASPYRKKHKRDKESRERSRSKSKKHKKHHKHKKSHKN